MKSPVVYDNKPVYFGILIGLVTAIILATSTYKILETWQLLAYLAIPAGIGFMCFAMRYGTIFTRKVSNPADPDKLVEGKVYWLNGEFKAVFLYLDKDLGQPVFQVDGLEDKIHVYPYKVSRYFSLQPEV